MVFLSSAPKVVLIVDDDAPIRELFEVMLERQGFKSRLAASGDEGLEGLKSGRYGNVDLILMDLMMPGSGGYDVLHKLQEPPLSEIPVIIVSAKGLDSETVALIRAEPNVKDYFKKPIVPHELTKRIHEILDSSPQKPFNNWQD